MEAGDAAYISTPGPLGIVSGSLIAANLTQNTDTILLGGLAGGAVGYTIPALTYPQHQGSAFDSIEATGIAATAALTAEGLGQYLGSHDAIQPEARPWFPTIGLTMHDMKQCTTFKKHFLKKTCNLRHSNLELLNTGTNLAYLFCTIQ